MKKKVSIIIPCHNEETSLRQLYAGVTEVTSALPDYDWELLFINDGSTDGTLQVIKELRESDGRIGYADLSRNFGKESAMLAGIDYATGDCAIIMDADLQDPPALIPEMLRWWEEGYQDVYARRKSRGKESWLRRRLTLAYYKLLQRTSRVNVLQNVGDFRLLDRKCLDALRQLRESERYTKGLFCWIGYRKKEIEFDRGDRVSGKSSYSLWTLFNLAIEGITSFTTAPLRIATLMGFVISFLTIIYIAYFLVKTLLYGDPVRGFPTLVIVTLFLGGVQLFSLGIIGEYLGKVYHETKRRPVYLVNEYAEANEDEKN
ncbi:MAG: glycosyltransferase family 2 protein [Muribaculaceae bacterium]|nr:glycosyltransferase family 2 protein [Muribaculaceae bacterium]